MATTNAAAFTQTEAEFKEAVEKMAGPFGLLEAAFANQGDGPYFNGKDYSLVDAAYAPFLQRHFYLERITRHGQMQRFPRFYAWANALVARPSTHSFPEAESEAMYRAIMKRWKPKTWISQFIDDEKAAAE
jgi:glutathione S-transferase